VLFELELHYQRCDCIILQLISLRRFRLGPDSVLPLGAPADGSELPRGSIALAVFPGTTVFYDAMIVAPPSKRRKPEYVLTFDEDEFPGMPFTPARRVNAKYVVAHPNSM